jgi:kinesin family member 1
MTGLENDEGLIPRIFKDLYSRINDKTKNNKGLKFDIQCSFLEIYNNKIKDLLNVKEDKNLGKIIKFFFLTQKKKK